MKLYTRVCRMCGEVCKTIYKYGRFCDTCKEKIKVETNIKIRKNSERRWKNKMGDRGNIKVGKVYLYTHWGGSEIKQILKNALSKKLRWDDEAYLTRIIFCEMIKEDVSGETGFGISTEICDNDNVILEVDVENQEVKFGDTIKTFNEFIIK